MSNNKKIQPWNAPFFNSILCNELRPFRQLWREAEKLSTDCFS